MASRGSGIGAGVRFSGGVGVGGIGTSTAAKSASPGQVYGGAAAKSAPQVHTALWVLVLIELAALVALRHAFRHHHGG